MESLSEWYPREVTPAHTGVYEVRIKEDGLLIRWFSCWNGSKWGLSAQSPEDAAKYCEFPSDAAEHAGGFEWRGITK